VASGIGIELSAPAGGLSVAVAGDDEVLDRTDD
jgi:hypothetical protein